MKRLLVLSVLAAFFCMTIAPAVSAADLSGKVVETMNSGGYTYVCLEKDGRKTWVAVPQMKNKIVIGQTMAFRPGAEMNKFESKTLKRTFDSIIFSEGVISGENEKQGSSSPGSKGTVVTSAEKISVKKASGPNAYTIAEIFRDPKALEKKNVVLKAKVIKVSANIMKKNWVHVQDGTGDPQKGSHDLVVTTQDLPAAGDIVTITGTLYNDKDFGGGYKYAVIVENATVKK